MLTYRAETWLLKKKYRHKLLATEIDYLRRSPRISLMERIRNERIRTKREMENDKLQETEQKLRWYGNLMRMQDCRIARKVGE
jgi:hypothetical protein